MARTAPVVPRTPLPEPALGVIYALLAYGAWGMMPLYWKTVAWLPAELIVAHRVVWSLLVLAVLLAWFGRFGALFGVLRNPRALRFLVLSALLITVNWMTFIWAVANERTVDASLGYFINPLLNVVLGLVFLQERLGPVQWLAVALAAAGVLWQTLSLGLVPWIALLLAGSFGCYGLVRKMAPVDGLLGLSTETLLLTPLALIYLSWADPGGVLFTGRGWAGVGLVVLSGLTTALPLLWFANAARRLRYSTLGFFQYLAPSGMLLLAVGLFGEPFTVDHLVSFGCIWTALLLYTWDSRR